MVRSLDHQDWPDDVSSTTVPDHDGNVGNGDHWWHCFGSFFAAETVHPVRYLPTVSPSCACHTKAPIIAVLTCFLQTLLAEFFKMLKGQ